MKYLVKELIDLVIEAVSVSAGGLEPPTLYLMNTNFAIAIGSIVLPTAPRSESPIAFLHTFYIYMI